MGAVADQPDVRATVGARRARGRAVRGDVPRSAHGDWAPGGGRRDAVALLEEQATTRVQELVPIRYGRMLATPFAFFRGAAAIMAADLAAAPRTGLHVQLCGDAHLLNFGIFAAPDRRLVFSVSDFDETLPGPFEWDVKRLAASFAVAGRTRGFRRRPRAEMIRAVVAAYRRAMHEFAAMRTLDLWYARLEVESARVRGLHDAVARARTKDSLRALDKLCDASGAEPRIVSDPPVIVPVDELLPGDEHRVVDDWATRILGAYAQTLSSERRRLLERFRYVHAARKVVGVGSVGTRCWIVLLVGRDGGDPLFLQFKEAQPSVLEPYLGAGAFESPAQRVVHGQRLMQAQSDILLGWESSAGLDGIPRDFYVRQLWDGKGSADVEVMDLAAMTVYGRLCAWTLARAHARSGDAPAIAAYLGSGGVFDRAVVAFAEGYADQNERDHSALQGAVAAGRVEARLDV